MFLRGGLVDFPGCIDLVTEERKNMSHAFGFILVAEAFFITFATCILWRMRKCFREDMAQMVVIVLLMMIVSLLIPVAVPAIWFFWGM